MWTQSNIIIDLELCLCPLYKCISNIHSPFSSKFDLVSEYFLFIVSTNSLEKYLPSLTDVHHLAANFVWNRFVLDRRFTVGMMKLFFLKTASFGGCGGYESSEREEWSCWT